VTNQILFIHLATPPANQNQSIASPPAIMTRSNKAINKKRTGAYARFQTGLPVTDTATMESSSELIPVKMIGPRGNHIYECEMGTGPDDQDRMVLVELIPRLRNVVWIRKGGLESCVDID
jgi:hypothetical protein